MSCTRRSLLACTGVAVAVTGSAGGCLRTLRGPPEHVLDEDGGTRTVGNVAYSAGQVENIGDNPVTAVELEIQFDVDGHQAGQTSTELGRIDPGEREQYDVRTIGSFVPRTTAVYSQLSAEWAR